MITQYTKYGLKALVALAKRHPTQQLTNIGELAEEEGIPSKFLELILLELKNLGWLHSKRGPRGGYALAKAPVEISLGEVFRQLEGPLAPVPCARARATELCDDCKHKRYCEVCTVMKEVRNSIAAVMDRTTLQDLLDQEHSYREEGVMYYI